MPGKSVLITGAKRGIGFGLVEQFAQDSEFDVVIGTSREPDADTLQALAKQYPGKVFAVRMDPQDENSSKQAAKDVEAILKGRGLDVLINNAGNAKPTLSLVEAPPALFHEMLDANVITAHNATAALLPLLQKAPTKKVINVSSLVGSITEIGQYPFPVSVYAISKSTLNSLTKWYAHYYAEQGFIFISLSPGYVKTALSPEGVISVEESAKGIIDVIKNKVSKETNGLLWSYDGSIHPF